MNRASLQNTIETAFDSRAKLDLPNAAPDLRAAVSEAIALLDRGEARVAEKGADCAHAAIEMAHCLRALASRHKEPR